MADVDRSEKKNHHSWFDWVQLFISLSIPLAIIVYTVVQNKNDTSIAEKNRQQDLEIAESRYKHDLQLAEVHREQDRFLAAEQQQEDLLMNYYTLLGKSLEKNGISLNGTPAARRIARLTTVTVLNQLNAKRKTVLLLSLLENELLTIQTDGKPTISLPSANLIGLNLFDQWGAQLPGLFPRINCIALDEAVLINASFEHRGFSSCSFTSSHLQGSDFSSTSATPIVCLDGPHTYGIDFATSILTKANFNTAEHFVANFKGAKLESTLMAYFTCFQCNFQDAALDLTVMSGAHLSECNFAYALFTSARLWNAQLQHCHLIKARLYHVNGTSASLDSCAFDAATLDSVLWSDSVIFNSSFVHATLTNCSLSRAKIVNTTFDAAQMHTVDFSHATCHHCRFHKVNFIDVDFTNASLNGSDFTDALVTYEQLARAASLQDVILPNGTIVVNR